MTRGKLKFINAPETPLRRVPAANAHPADASVPLVAPAGRGMGAAAIINIAFEMPPEGVKVRTFAKDGIMRDLTLVQRDGELVFEPGYLRPLYDVTWWEYLEDDES